MKIRLALTLDIRRARDDGEAERDSQLDSLVETADQRHQHPRIGFTSFETEEP